MPPAGIHWPLNPHSHHKLSWKVKKLLLQQLNSNTNSHPAWIFKTKQWGRMECKEKHFHRRQSQKREPRASECQSWALATRSRRCVEDGKPIASMFIMSLLSKPEVSLLPATRLVPLLLDLDYSNVAVTLSHYKAFLEFASFHNNIQISVLHRIK